MLVVFTGCITKQPNATSPHQISTVSPNAGERLQESATTPTHPETPSARYNINITKVEHLIHEKMNERRRVRGVKPLEYQPKLAKVGQYKSWHMAKFDYFAHTGPNGTSHQELRRQFNSRCSIDGQNLYKKVPSEYAKVSSEEEWGSKQIAEEAVISLMNSTGHRKNILNPKYDIEGIGVFIDKSGTIYVTQELCGYY